MKKWSLQLRRSLPDGMPAGSNGSSLQQQEMSLMQERTLPSSPSPLYSSHSKSSAFMKGGMAQPSSRKQLMGGHPVLDNSKGLLQWVQSISFVSVSVDHSLQLVVQADSSPGTYRFTLIVFAMNCISMRFIALLFFFRHGLFSVHVFSSFCFSCFFFVWRVNAPLSLLVLLNQDLNPLAIFD